MDGRAESSQDFRHRFQIASRDLPRSETSQMRRRALAEAIAFCRISEKSRDRVAKRWRVSVWKRHAARADGFGQTTAGRSNHDATARDPFQGHDSKRFLPERGHHEDFVLAQRIRQLLAMTRPGELALR